MTTTEPSLTRTISNDQYEKMRSELADLRSTVNAYASAAKGDNCFLQMKCASQRDALRLLNKRVVNQRFALRTLENLGRGLTNEEKKVALATDPKARLVDPKDVLD